MIVRRKDLSKWIIYLFFFTGFLNAVLRLYPESGITLFRCLIPFALIVLLLKQRNDFLLLVILACILFFYSLGNSLIYYGQFNLPFFLHYATLIFLYFFVKYAVEIVGIEGFFTFLKSTYVLIICLCLIQLFIGGVYPNTLDRSGEAINIFFFNEGDLTACIAILILILFVKNEAIYTRLIISVLGVLILVYDDARLSLIAMFIFFSVFIFKKLATLGLFIAILLLSLVIFLYGDQIVLGGNSLTQLLIEPLDRIVNLDPYPTIYGSIYTRTNSVIFGISEIINSYGFGIGPGNSYLMLESGRYYLEDAKSLHNFVLQVLVELGWFGLLILGYLGSVILRLIYLATPSRRLLLVAFYFCGTLIVTSLSSSAFSNYLLFTVFYFSIFYFKKDGMKMAN